jgi:hypothetical protein
MLSSSWSPVNLVASGAAAVDRLGSLMSYGNLLGVCSGPSGSGVDEEEEEVEDCAGEAGCECEHISASSGRGVMTCSCSELMGV